MAGGENLAQTWNAMLVTLLPPAEARRERTESQAREALHGRDEFPYLPRRGSFREGPRLAFNSCGGWPMEWVSPQERESIAGALGEAGFVSVRERHSELLLRSLPKPVKSVVAPDCGEISGLERCVGLEELPGLAQRTVPPAEARIEELRRQVWRNFEALGTWL